MRNEELNADQERRNRKIKKKENYIYGYRDNHRHTHTHKTCTQLQCPHLGRHAFDAARQGGLPKKPCTSHHKGTVQAWNAAARQRNNESRNHCWTSGLILRPLYFGVPVSLVCFENASSPSRVAPQRRSMCGLLHSDVLHATFIAHVVATRSRSHIN